LTCGLCGGHAAVRLFEKNGYTIVRCRACGLIQVEEGPEPQELERLYDEAYFTSDVFHDYVGERDARIESGARAARALTRIVPTGKLLDIGCAAGFFLHAASRYYEVTGVEISPFAADYARKEFGLRVLTGDVGNADLEGEQFDVVTMWNTIEHMREPLRSVTSVAPLTRPGGLLVLSTGDASGPLARRGLEDWNLMSPPHHLFFFTRRTLDELLARAGFRTRRFVYDGVIAERGQLASPRVSGAATFAGLGNVMTVYASREEAELPHRSTLRGVTARWRPLSRVLR
jgi:SAM-dependent methyltransferase